MALLTLTSDIGEKDFIAGAIKGRLVQFVRHAQIIDISHSLAPFNIPQSAYICRNAFKHFPEGTYHVVIANMFDAKPTHLLGAKHDGHYIFCADNGLLTMLLEEVPQEVVALPLQKTAAKTIVYFAEVIGDAINKLESGKTLEQIGDASVEIVVKNAIKPLLGNNWMEGQIILIDNFENVVVNINREQFEEQRKGRSFQIVFRREEYIDKISESYADVHEGEKLATFNSAGYLEISINKGNAAGLFGMKGYSETQFGMQHQFLANQMVYQTVKVFFGDHN